MQVEEPQQSMANVDQWTVGSPSISSVLALRDKNIEHEVECTLGRASAALLTLRFF